MKTEDSNSKLMTHKAQIIKLSASSVKTYDQCPRKYYYTYIDKKPTKEWDHFDLGNICHRALEIFHITYMEDGLKIGSLSKLMTHSFKESLKEFPNLSDNLKEEARDLLNGYLKSISKNMPTVKSVEADFTVNLSENVIVRGFVDRLDVMRDARYHIVDYKTTKNAKYLDPLQLKIYGIWLKEVVDPTIDSFKASYVLLRQKSSLKEYEFNLEDIEKTKQELLSYASAIGKENTWMPVPTRLCDWCDFKSICPPHTEDSCGW